MKNTSKNTSIMEVMITWSGMLQSYFIIINTRFSRPGKPTDNPYIESFNGSFRDECLNAHWFLSLEDAKDKIEIWPEEYHTFRPHSFLGNLTPDIYLEKQAKIAEFSILEDS